MDYRLFLKYEKLDKYITESLNGLYATNDEANQKNGELWFIEGSFDSVLDFLENWELAPIDISSKGKFDIVLFNADNEVYGIYKDDDVLDIFITSKEINHLWKTHNPSTKKVTVAYGSDLINTKSALKRFIK